MSTWGRKYSKAKQNVICLHKAASGSSICSWVRIFIAGEGFRCGQNFVAGAGFRCGQGQGRIRCGQDFRRDRFSMRTGAGSISMRTEFCRGGRVSMRTGFCHGDRVSMRIGFMFLFDCRDSTTMLGSCSCSCTLVVTFDADRIFVLVRLPRFARLLFSLCTSPGSDWSSHKNWCRRPKCLWYKFLPHQGQLQQTLGVSQDSPFHLVWKALHIVDLATVCDWSSP